MIGRLRILYVAPYQPSPLAVRPRLLLGEIARRHDVTVLAVRRRSAAAADPIGHLEQRAFPSRPIDRVIALRHLADGAYPLQAMAVASPQLRVAVHHALRHGEYDVVHVEHVRALQFLPPRCEVPVLFDAVDCVSSLFEHAAMDASGGRRRLFAAEARRLRRCEAAALARVDTVVVAARRDADALARLRPHPRIAVVTNPVDLERCTPGAWPRPATVVMTGKMSFHANAAAARWLCEAIWPLVVAEHRDARLAVAGAAPPASVRRLAAPTIAITDYVPDIAGVINAAAVAVAPLRYAAGVQNKLLEALACATPVVATPVAVGDLPLRSGRDVIVATTAAEVAAGIRFLLANPDLAREIGDAGRRYVEEHHGVDTVAAALESEYLELAGRGAAGARMFADASARR